VVLPLCYALLATASELMRMRGPVVASWLAANPAVAPATASLAVTILQHIHQALQGPAGSSLAVQLHDRIIRVWYYLMGIPANASSWVPQLTPSIAAAGCGMLIMAAAHVQHMRQLGLQAPASTEPFAVRAEWCWQVATSPSVGVGTLPTHLVLPPHLEQLLGCNNRTLRWLGAVVLSDTDHYGREEPASHTGGLSRAILEASQALSPEQQQGSHEAELYLLLSSLLVQLTAGDPCSPADLTRLYSVVAGAFAALETYRSRCLPQQPGEIRQAKTQLAAARQVLQWAEVALPSLLVLIAQLTQRLPTTGQTIAAAGDSSGASGAGAGAAAWHNAPPVMPGLTPSKVLHLSMLMLESLLLCSVVRQQPVPKIWCDYNAQLCTVLDCLVRALAAGGEVAAAAVRGGASSLLPSAADSIEATATVFKVTTLLCDSQGGVLSRVAATAPVRDQLLLFSLQCSMLKLSSRTRPCQLADAICLFRANAVEAVAFVLTELASRSQQQQQQQQPGAACSLPWLVLFGRCCLQWAENLLQLINPSSSSGSSSGSSGGSRAASSSSGSSNSCCAESGDCQPQWLASLSQFQQLELRTFVHVMSHLNVWFGQPRCQGMLADAGYPAELVAQLIAAVEAPVLLSANQGCFPNAPTELLASFREVGTGLLAFAVPQCCNNPSCSNTSKQSELELVAGRSCKCSQCRVARYCGKGCQAQHWKQHKAVCTALAAAAAAAPAAGAGCPA
jgi:hypothetical protein